ncbi:hypothetical protein ACVWXO_011057 [Bradyrhizobium sp. LM2.7]
MRATWHNYRPGTISFRPTECLSARGPADWSGRLPILAAAENPVLKLVADYGIIGLIVFLFYLLLSIFRKDNSMLALTMLACYQLGGGNLAMAPFLIMMAMLCVWSQPPSAGLRSIRRPASVQRMQSSPAPIIE